MFAWSVLIWACLAAMAAVISLMGGTVLAELEECQQTDPAGTSCLDDSGGEDASAPESLAARVQTPIQR